MKSTGSLPNDYIPSLTPTEFRKILYRLPVDSINNLAYLWCRLTTTQPALKSPEEYKQSRLVQQGLVKKALEFFQKNVAENNYSKRQLLDKVLVEFWHKGLNLLQISQIDCQLIIDKPTFHLWSVSKLINDRNEPVEIKIVEANYQQLVRNIAKQLKPLYLNYMYLCHHPEYPLTIIRIQLFDIGKSKTMSRKPFFIGLPSSSTRVIHSEYKENDIAAKLIMQCVQECLSKGNSPVHLIKSEEQLRNFKSAFLMNASSRFNSCVGSWTCYADNNVDITPFENPNKEDDDTDSDELKVIEDQKTIDELNNRCVANLRFKGNKRGRLVLKELYETNRQAKKAKVDSESESDLISSIIPMQNVEFEVKLHRQPTFKIRFHGTDIFGGLHQLALDRIVNARGIPDWLTGEVPSGTIKDNKFQRALEQDYFEIF